MTTALTIYKNIADPMAAAKVMGDKLAKARVMGVKNADEGFILAFNCLAMGMSLMEYDATFHTIQGKRAMKSDAMHSKFLQIGGRVKYVTSTEAECEAIFTHPEYAPTGFNYKITIAQAKQAGLLSNPTWKNWPARMLQVRCLSMGIRAVCPIVNAGYYSEAEQDVFEEPPQATTTVVTKPVEFVADAPQVEQPKETKALPPAKLTQTLDWFAGKGWTIDAQELEVAVKGRYEPTKEAYPPEKWTEDDWKATSKWMQELSVMDPGEALTAVQKLCGMKGE